MSRCAHSQSDFKIAQLPQCRKCKKEMMLVTASYENVKEHVWEWECIKCGKIYPASMTDNSYMSEQDKRLSKWCKDEQRKQDYSR